MPGTEVLAERGHYDLVLDESCAFWMQTSSLDQLGIGHQGVLDATQRQMVSDLLHLDLWPDLQPSYLLGLCDAPIYDFSLGDQRIRINTTCGASGRPPPDFLLDALDDLQSLLRSVGEEAQGPVRYSLVIEETAPADTPTYANAPPWPLALDPSSIAVSELDSPGAFPDYVATALGEDAAALRALRTEVIDGSIGVTWAGFIPIEEASDQRYRLNVRDMAPEETAPDAGPM